MMGSIVLGVIGGCLGALFININTRTNALRKKCLKSKWSKPLETALFSGISTIIVFATTYLTYYKGWCEINKAEYDADNEINLKRGWCSENEYDPLASHFFTSEGGVIRNILDDRISLTLS
jgi:hypothetical protein